MLHCRLVLGRCTPSFLDCPHAANPHDRHRLRLVAAASRNPVLTGSECSIGKASLGNEGQHACSSLKQANDVTVALPALAEEGLASLGVSLPPVEECPILISPSEIAKMI